MLQIVFPVNSDRSDKSMGKIDAELTTQKINKYIM